jgi:hypothetical protein
VREVGKYYLLANFAGYGNKGDAVEVVRTIGDLVLVKNGDKQFCVEKIKAISICPVHPQQAPQR